ncbi:hypothetical protein [Deinococcus aerophilus]|uniref:DUF2207 domain-containing protein n=1 Tax=Deinococcus aerophilus TaxID=522488 RepID=A0ABQ2GJG7_9DEIO|nr:hypothetical protein [Deinococcus aerophilus]GGL98643.1 hypothetical protein GCM10010841_03830 [Deinococcus aerophilus]
MNLRFWVMCLLCSGAWSAAQTAPAPPPPVSYALLPPDGSFGDVFRQQREHLCARPAAQRVLTLGMVRNTTPGTPITVRAQLAYASEVTMSFSAPADTALDAAPPGVARPLRLRLAQTGLCAADLPSRLFLVTTARASGTVPTPAQWTPLTGARSVAAPVLNLSAHVGSTQLSPAWLSPAQLHGAPPTLKGRPPRDPAGRLAWALGWITRQEPQGPAPVGETEVRFALVRTDDPRLLTVRVQDVAGGWAYLRLGSAPQHPGRYSGSSPFQSGGAAVPVTLSVRESPLLAGLCLVLFATLGWGLNWLRKQVLTSLDVVASVRAYRTHIEQDTVPAAFGYAFREPVLTELNALLAQASAAAGILAGDHEGLAEVRAALAALKQREHDWTEALVLLERLRDRLTRVTAPDVADSDAQNLVSALEKLLEGTFHNPGEPTPRAFTSELWGDGETGLKAELRAALHLTQVLLDEPYSKYRPLPRAAQVLASRPTTLKEIEQATRQYGRATARAEAAEQRLKGFRLDLDLKSLEDWAPAAPPPAPVAADRPVLPSVPWWPALPVAGLLGLSALLATFPALWLPLLLTATLLGFMLLISMAPPARWSAGGLRWARRGLGTAVFLAVTSVTVVSGFSTQYVANPTWGASVFDYFAALLWGLGLAGGLSLLLDVVAGLRWRVGP